MKKLIERLEKATGPDRELDGDISETIGFYPSGYRRGEPRWASMHWFASDPASWACPCYTASIDAALTLVPESWCFDLTQIGDRNPTYHAYLSYAAPEFTVDSCNLDEGDVKHPALALCIAALKARKQLSAD